MNILWLDHPARVDRYDKWLYFEFAKQIQSKDNNVYFYAPRMQELMPEFTPLRYEANRSMADVALQLNLDVIILNGKTASFLNYFPKTNYPNRDEGNSWLPKDFRGIKVPKIAIEEDYHYEYTDEWHETMGFRVILQRHYSQYQRKMLLPVHFFPFSVDTEVFKPQNRFRKNMVAFIGIVNERVYPYRYKAKNVLHEGRIIDVFDDRSKVSDAYVDVLQDYVAYLSGGSRYHLTPAKMLEIIASGGVLLTNKLPGIDNVLPDDCYISYKNDCSDIMENTLKLLKHQEYREDVAQKGLTHVRKNHSHEVRIKQLLNIIKQYT